MDSIALIVGASKEEFAHVQQCLSGWECVRADLNDEKTVGVAMPATTTLNILYARKNESDTLAICEQLRASSESSATPILLVISRYLITQVAAVKSNGNAAFIIVPFDEKELQEKVAELLGQQ